MKRLKKLLPKTRKGRIWLLVLLVLAVGIWWTVYWLSSPSKGVVVAKPDPAIAQKTKVLSTRPPDEAPSAPSSVTNDYFTLSLPAGYSLPSATSLPAGLLYQATILKSSRIGSLIINIAIAPLPEGGLTNDTSYHLRDTQPQYYTFQTVKGGVPIATDKRSGNVVAFWQYGSYLATISVSAGVDSNDPVSNAQLDTLNTLLQGWEWR